MMEIPLSLALIQKRVEHYTELMNSTTCDVQKLCYDLVIVELELIIEEITDDHKRTYIRST